MKRCPNCGAEVEDQARFCSSCGAPLAPVAEEPVFESASETVEPPVQPVDPLDGQPAPQEDDFEFTPPVYGGYEQQIQQEEPASSEDYYAPAPPHTGMSLRLSKNSLHRRRTITHLILPLTDTSRSNRRHTDMPSNLHRIKRRLLTITRLRSPWRLYRNRSVAGSFLSSYSSWSPHSFWALT